MTRSHLRRVLSFWLASVLMCAVIAAPQASGQSKGRKEGGSVSDGGRVPANRLDEHSAANWARSQGPCSCQILMVTVV